MSPGLMNAGSERLADMQAQSDAPTPGSGAPEWAGKAPPAVTQLQPAAGCCSLPHQELNCIVSEQ